MYEYTDKAKVFAIGKLISTIYKMLETFEKCKDTMPERYVDSVIDEINSASDLLFNSELVHIVVQLNMLKKPENQNHKKVKKIVFDCTNGLSRIRDVMLNG